MNDQDLTDLFAGLAMQGLLASDTRTPLVRETAEYAYDIAEAMVASRCPCNLRMKEFPEHCGEDCCICWGKSILNEWGGRK